MRICIYVRFGLASLGYIRLALFRLCSVYDKISLLGCASVVKLSKAR